MNKERSLSLFLLPEQLFVKEGEGNGIVKPIGAGNGIVKPIGE